MARGRKKESLTPEEHLQAALVPESEQPYKVPGNWCWTYLTKGAAECLDSFRKPINASERANREGDIPYYGATGQVGWIDDFLTNEQLVLVGEDGAPFLDLIKDKAYIIEGKAWVNNHAHILRSRFGAVGNLFLLHYLNIFNYHDFVNGTTRLKLTQSSMDTMPVPIPPFSEQQRIVDRIESLFAKLDEAKQKAQDALDSFETRKAAILHKAFTGELTAQWRKEHGVGMESWENLKFENIIEDGPQNGLYKPQTAYGTGTKTLRIDCFYDGAVLPWENLKRLALTKNEIEQYHLNVNDIVINRVNSMAYLGKSALIRELPEECVFESNRIYDEKIIDCCKVDPESLLDHIYQEGKVNVRPHDPDTQDEKVLMTADLLENCFEKSNTGIRIFQCQERVNRLAETMNALYKTLEALKKPTSKQYLRALKGMLSREYKFSGFTRYYVRSHIEEYPQLFGKISFE